MNQPFWKIAEWEKSGVINKYAFLNIAEWEKSGVVNKYAFWNIAEWEKSGVINNDAFWNNAEWEKSGVMNNFGFWTAKTVEPDAPPFGTGRIKLRYLVSWAKKYKISGLFYKIGFFHKLNLIKDFSKTIIGTWNCSLDYQMSFGCSQIEP